MKNRRIQTFIIPDKREKNGATESSATVLHERLDERLDEIEREKWIKKYQDKIARIPDSNGCRYYIKSSKRIGIICDEFYWDFISGAADFIYITPENWRKVLDAGLDAFLFVTSWRGLHNEWRDLVSKTVLKSRYTAQMILLECRRLNIPTIFYSMETPSHYYQFLDYAKLCDYIFSSVEECLPLYAGDCGKKPGGAIPFGVNPCYYNPIGSRLFEKEKTVLFAGSWFSQYQERCEDLSMLFDGVLDTNYNLRILNRNDPEFKGKRDFPSSYTPYTVPSAPHNILRKLHKLFDWALNVNSVKNSETMFAMRTFELLANGASLISNFSVGAHNKLPDVLMAHDSEEIPRILNAFTPEELYERQTAGIRSVMTGHTCYDRLYEILKPVGLAEGQPTRKILVLADHITDEIRKNFDRQSYPYKFLISRDEINSDVSKLSEYDMIAWFDQNAQYGEFYLEDMANGFKYTNCDYIAKDAWMDGDIFHPGAEHNYISFMKNRCRSLFWREAFDAEFLLNPPESCELKNGYAIDYFNYNARNDYKAAYNAEKKSKSFAISVIISVFNNGRHLYGKCFASLRRSSVFDQMEIILVDDGSTDGITPLYESCLARSYGNIKLYCFPKGGSGSASRPRNKGVEMATAPYIIFLDPDDETVCDGYAALLQEAEAERWDVILSNRYRVEENGKKRTVQNYYERMLIKLGRATFLDSDGDWLEATNYYTPGLNCMLIRRDFLLDTHIAQVVGGTSHDTQFCMELLHRAKRIHGIKAISFLYYACTSGSTTNRFTVNYFNKLLLTHQRRVSFLREENLTEDYMKNIFPGYAEQWIIKKLIDTDERDSPVCAEIVEKILKIYMPYFQNNSPFTSEFLDLCASDGYQVAVDFTRKNFPASKEISAAPPVPRVQVTVETTENGILCQVDFPEKNAFTRYAYYLYGADGELQDKQMYIDRPFFEFYIKKPGYYYIRGFVRGKNSEHEEFYRVPSVNSALTRYPRIDEKSGEKSEDTDGGQSRI